MQTFLRWRFVLLAVAMVVPKTLVADEDNIRSGLHAVVSDGSHSISMMSRRLSFDWTDSSPDSRIGSPFSSAWNGNLLVRQPGKHTFHAMVSGSVSILIDDAQVLDAKGENVFHSGEGVELSAGDHRIQIQFQSMPDTDAKLQLFWSSPEFTLEPLPADALSHEVAEAETAHAESGRFLADALRCAACHSGIEELPPLKAPSLLRVNELPQAEIVSRLMNPHMVNKDSMMPAFGFSQEEALSVAEFLRGAAEKDIPVETADTRFEPEDSAAGSRMLLTKGCVACHAVSQLENAAQPLAFPYQGPSLEGIANRRDATWLMTWLKSPERLNADHRMPVFALSDKERKQIVAALLGPDDEAPNSNAGENKGSPEVEAAGPKEVIEQGRQLVLTSNCAACHRIAGIEPAKKIAVVDWNAGLSGLKSCVRDGDDSQTSGPALTPGSGSKKGQPRYALNKNHQTQLHAWLAGIKGHVRPASGAAGGELLVHRNGCLGCHDRDQHRGLSQLAGIIEAKNEVLRGQSQTLIPPALTAVGDKLKDEYLAAAVAGEQTRRLPWLLVQMPKFALSTDDRSQIVSHFVASDRIPDAADVARPELFEHLNPHHPTLATPSELLIGNQLTGASGFNCIACHTAGSYEPRNVAMGTRGSDIMTMGARLRSRYFMRWMQNPIRVVPGIEMPAIRKAIPGVLEDSLPQQISTIWKALADPKFSPPTVVSRYEQFITVAPGQRPRIIRDVFTVGDPKERNSVARAFAIGFNNGHNLLLDLDTMQLRQWSIGEFARQRTEGKSWFWDMAGVSVSTTPEDILVCHLKSEESPSSDSLSPVKDQRRLAELLSWKQTQTQVRLRIRYHYQSQSGTSQPAPSPESTTKATELSRHTATTAWNDPERKLQQATVEYVIQPTPLSGTTTGWRIRATAVDCPDGYSLQFDAWRDGEHLGELPWTSIARSDANAKGSVSLSQGQSATLTLQTDVVPGSITPPSLPRPMSRLEPITSLPGFDGQRLPVDTAIMPTAMTWLSDGRLAFVSLRGQVWIAKDTDGDSLMDSLSLFAEGLAAPYGIHADGDSILVSHKPEVVRLRDSDADGTADEFDVFASGWGFSDDYHDWTTGLVRDNNGSYFLGLGSDYSQNNRPADNDRWRGTVLKIDTTGAVTPVAWSFRFPMGLAFDHHQNLFATDNQGVQNTFNEINHVIMGKHYGVPSRHETVKDIAAESPALMVPHPWTRSVNSIVFFPQDFALPELAGHGVGCEYDTRCLIRFTVQDVNGTLQGACYRFSLSDQPGGGGNFVGPVSSLIGADGALYIGSIWDSGWQGGTNTGTIERMVPSTMLNGIREIRANAAGFEVSFFHPVDERKAADSALWSLQAYTRAWGGSYATPDSDRHSLTPESITVANDRKSVLIAVNPLKAGYVYEISVRKPLDDSAADKFWPSEGHYTMKVVPGK